MKRSQALGRAKKGARWAGDQGGERGYRFRALNERGRGLRRKGKRFQNRSHGGVEKDLKATIHRCGGDTGHAP